MNSDPESSNGLSKGELISKRMEEACKKHGVKFHDTTKEHLGETSIIFIGKQDTEKNEFLETQVVSRTEKIKQIKPTSNKADIDETNKITYYRSDFEEDFLVRSEESLGCWIKPRGKAEFKEQVATNIVANFLLEGKQITKEEYERF